MRRSALLCLFLLPLAAQAATKDELAQTQVALKISEEKKEKLLKQERQMEEDLAALQEKLVRAASGLQKSDASLAEAEKKLAETEASLARKEQDAKMARAKLDGLSRVAVRLSRTPPQAMVLMPADGKNRLQAAHALSMITSEIKAQAAALAAEMEALIRLRARQAKEKETAVELKAAYAAEKKSFEVAVKERKKLRARLATSRAKEEANIAALAKKAGSLQELMAALESRTASSAKSGGKEVVSVAGVSGKRGEMRRFADAKGRIRIPVSGRVASGYGTRDLSGEAAKGIRIATRASAPVVAPFDAEVAYSGTFLNYGRLVILKHRGDYHTLLAGLSRMDVQSGDFLLEGEPIGAMGNTDNEQLYVELRENNQPINPKPWLRGL